MDILHRYYLGENKRNILSKYPSIHYMKNLFTFSFPFFSFSFCCSNIATKYVYENPCNDELNQTMYNGVNTNTNIDVTDVVIILGKVQIISNKETNEIDPIEYSIAVLCQE